MVEPLDYRDVPGWLTDTEAEELTRLATGRVVLEVGTFCGKSAVAMARTAAKVYCVDDYRGCCGSGSVVQGAMRTFDRAATWGKIVPLVGTQEDVLPMLDLSKVDMVFYDADHSRESTDNGIQLLAGLREDAVVVFHDYATTNPGVVAAVDSYARRTGRGARAVDSLAIFESPMPAPLPAYRVMLGMPHNGQICYGAAQGLFRSSVQHNVTIQDHGSSLLAGGFNYLWSAALDRAAAGDITHIAFLHGDIAPCDYWIDILIRELESLDADFVSVVVPIKDRRGLTSTAIGAPGLAWAPYRRLTVREVLKLPETFDIDTAGFPGKILLHNSGCWVADLRKPVFHQSHTDADGTETASAFFTIRDRVTKVDGRWGVQVEPEDWFFARRLHELGAKTYATRKVRVDHYGPTRYNLDEPWGDWEVDEATQSLWGQG